MRRPFPCGRIHPRVLPHRRLGHLPHFQPRLARSRDATLDNFEPGVLPIQARRLHSREVPTVAAVVKGRNDAVVAHEHQIRPVVLMLDLTPGVLLVEAEHLLCQRLGRVRSERTEPVPLERGGFGHNEG